MADIHVAIKSYKRAGMVKTLDVMPFGYVWVPESQGDEYREQYGDRVVTIPDELDGNLSRKQNAILGRSPSPWTLIVDDDISRIGCFEDGGKRFLGPDEVWWMIGHGFDLAAQLGVELWGINPLKDDLGYNTYKPFNLLSVICGPFHGHLAPTLRYDESVLSKDDYDFWLQNIRVHRKTLRLNRYHYVHDHGIGSGGLTCFRSLEYEKQGIERMKQKWGKAFSAKGMAGGKSASGKNILNTTVRVPIPGC